MRIDPEEAREWLRVQMTVENVEEYDSDSDGSDLDPEHDFCAVSQELTIPNYTNTLPEETLYFIFRLALPPSWVLIHGGSLPPFPRPIWSADMCAKRAITGVCKTWHRIGVEFLYENVMLRSIGQLPAFVRTLETRRELGSFVRRLDVSCMIPRGYSLLYSTEMEKLFSLNLCPSLTHFTVNPSPAEGVVGLRAPIGTNSTITNLDIGMCDWVNYPDIYPSLAALSQTLASLSITLPADYDVGLPQLTFTHLENMRLDIRLSSVVPTAHWALPSLQRLCLPNWETWEAAPDQIGGKLRDFVTVYGRSLTYLEAPQITRTDLAQAVLESCPALVHLGLYVNGSHFLPAEGAGLHHARVATLDIFAHPSSTFIRARSLELSGVDIARVRSRFPRLRAWRYVDTGMNFLADLLPPPTLVVCNEGRFPEYDAPSSSYFAILMSDVGCADEDSDVDPDYVQPESSDSDEDTDDTDDEMDWEIDRDEALVIYQQTLRRLA
ncbi:hypothetical protein GGX14DRAFT_610946 [Mycena pura]|uniref:F-box domain-containing protein n=1 Tax=Mycena pura TaxID=153505 RepID=A0AAD6YD13_9AGAR|nr:hypothetical protein GGX14DRAFT_610946 [Mycena pura]